MLDGDVWQDIGKVFGIMYDRTCQRMFGTSFQGIENGLQALVLRVPYGIGHYGFSFGDGAGFIQYDCIYLFGYLQAFGIFNQDTLFGTFANAHHDSGRSGKPQGTRAGDNQHGNGGKQSVGKSVFGSECKPADKGKQGDSHDGGDKYACNLIHQFLNRGFAPLCVLYHVDDVCQHGVGSHFFGTEPEASFLVDSACVDFIGYLFQYRYRLAAQHAFVYV